MILTLPIPGYIPSKIVRKQEISDVHGFDAFIVTASEFIRPQHILRIIVPDVKEPVIFPAFGLFRCDAHCHLDIDFLIAPCGNKVNLTIIGFTDIHRIPTAAKFQINYMK